MGLYPCIVSFFDANYTEKEHVQMEKNEGRTNCDLLLDVIKDIQYGSVTVHIQDGKIVYIEKTEKIKVKG